MSNGWFPAGRAVVIPDWRDTPEFQRRRSADPLGAVRALKARERLDAAMGGGWGGPGAAPWAALIFADARGTPGRWWERQDG